MTLHIVIQGDPEVIRLSSILYQDFRPHGIMTGQACLSENTSWVSKMRFLLYIAANLQLKQLIFYTMCGTLIKIPYLTIVIH